MPKKDQVIAAQEFVREVMEDEGPFDAVIGFSQGAALTSSMVLEYMKTNPKGRPIQPLHIRRCQLTVRPGQ